MKRLTTLFVFLLTLIISNHLKAQTPPARTWFFNNYGQKTTVKERWFEDENGQRHGKYIRYDYSYFGNEYYVAESGNYVHGKQNGEWKVYYDNGDLCDIGFYSNDYKTGKWKENYSRESKVFQEGYYLNNSIGRTGEWINTNGQNVLLPHTELRYRTIYKNGIPVQIFNPSGEDILLKEKLVQEEADKQRWEWEKNEKYQQQMKQDFNKAMNKYQDITFNTYYGDTTYLHNFLINYPNANQEYVNQAKEAISDKSDNDVFYSAQNIKDYANYQKRFPEGIHIAEVNETVKNNVVEKVGKYKNMIGEYLNEGNSVEAINLSELILRYKDDIHDSYYLKVVIYYSLALWSTNSNKAVDSIKPYTTSIIHYSNEDKKFMKEYWIQYDIYKKALGLEDKKDIYKAIKAL